MLAASGSTIKFWNTENFELIQNLHTNSSNISSLSWNKDGHILASLDEKTSEISMYTVSSSTAICSAILRIMDNINCLQFCNTINRYMAVGGGRDSVLIWDVKGNAKKKSFMVTRAGITKLCFSNSDSHLAVGTVQGDGFLLSNTNNLVTGPVKLFSEKTKVMDIRYSFICRALVGVCAENGSFALLDTNTTKVLKEFPQVHSAPASAVAFSPINELLMITVGCDKRFITYNANMKSVVMAHQTTAPLTSVCFLASGQYVALGTMTGEVFIYDLRVLNTPMVTLDAQEGPVLDLRIQPQGKVAQGGNSAKAMSGSKKTDITVQVEKTKASRKTDKAGINTKTEKSCSPSVELLSPMKVQTNRLEKMKNTPLLKSLARTPRSSKSGSVGMDELGILSPIDKENKSPSSSHPPESPPKQSSVKPNLMVEGFLSPLDSSPKSNQSNSVKSWASKQSSRNVNEDCDKSSRGDKEDLTEIVDDLLSPLRNESSITPKPVTLSSESPRTLNTKETFSQTTENETTGFPSKMEMHPEERRSARKERGRSSSVDRVKRNILKDRAGEPAEAESLSASFSDLAVQSPQKELRKTPEKNRPANASKSYDVHCQVEEGLRSSSKRDRQIQKMLGNAYPKEDDVIFSAYESKCLPEPSKEVSGQTTNQDVSTAFELAFPVTEKETQDAQTRDIKKPSDFIQHQRNNLRTNSSSCDVNNINLELIRNCVSEALERHQFCVNQRFMHMQYTMVKHFFNLRNDMKKLIKESSLNEELLAENEKLRQEIERLRHIY